MRQLRSSVLIASSVSLLIVLFWLACQPGGDKAERLARNYCASCHMFPNPGLLDKRSWKATVLPQMAMLMGVPDSLDVFSKIPPPDQMILAAHLPQTPMVSRDEWQMIKRYFIDRAPDTVSITEPATMDSLTLFDAMPGRLFKTPLLTMIQADTINRRIFVGNRYGDLFTLNYSLHRIDSIRLASTPSHLVVEGNKLIVSLMGIMDPNDQPLGTLAQIEIPSQRKKVLIDSLQRPVYFEHTDLDGDGIKEFIICEFGNYTGGLTVYQESADHGFSRHVIDATPGARKVVVQDFTGDGHPDVLAMITQGNERIVLFENRGRLEFSEHVLLRFPPVYGSNYFEIHDFNNDGHFDLLTTNGDNGDFTPILKPYHAVRIFLNDGHNNFQQSWSYALPGVSQAAAFDFDRDGDLDVAVIAFFPDFVHHPERSFVYFENKGPAGFVPHATPLAARGRWLVMERADVDADGDEDILLGATNFQTMGAGPMADLWAREGVPFMLLRNKTR